ncbi:hypothetical protein P6F26_15505 [Roseibacterium sp. SDUM158017]|uniref:hypothetical protein n=1 Tax=Roseicyclus salinarum TaxID=3036773 RepID=UPI0024156249|nr:hypothetical protein [Roseibacterium sp. SDUM158017]MDG4649851.1 hypothetical protein [Roseibacterium sp. SDUM158017]
MSAKTLHIFAVNGDSDLRHTHLSRAKGEAPELPDLRRWLGVETLDTDRIELFPLKELDGTRLSQYVTMAFDPVPLIDTATAARLDALDGSVLLVPDTAFTGVFHPGAELTRIATLSLALPDHDADLPRADVTPYPAPGPDRFPPERAGGSGKGIPQWAKFAIFIAIFVLLYILLDG